MIEHPKTIMSDEALGELIRLYVPHFCVILIGPVPFGHRNPIMLKVGYIICERREEAVGWAMAWAEHVCEAYSYAFDPEDWSVGEIIPVNCN